MLGMETQSKPQNLCYDCKSELMGDGNFQCKYCKKRIHIKCAESIFGKDDIAQAVVQKAFKKPHTLKKLR